MTDTPQAQTTNVLSMQRNATLQTRDEIKLEALVRVMAADTGYDLSTPERFANMYLDSRVSKGARPEEVTQAVRNTLRRQGTTRAKMYEIEVIAADYANARCGKGGCIRYLSEAVCKTLETKYVTQCDMQDITSFICTYGDYTNISPASERTGHGLLEVADAVCQTLLTKRKTGYDSNHITDLIICMRDSFSCRNEYTNSISESVCDILKFAKSKGLKIPHIMARINELEKPRIEEAERNKPKGFKKFSEVLLPSNRHYNVIGIKALTKELIASYATQPTNKPESFNYEQE